MDVLPDDFDFRTSSVKGFLDIYTMKKAFAHGGSQGSIHVLEGSRNQEVVLKLYKIPPESLSPNFASDDLEKRLYDSYLNELDMLEYLSLCFRTELFQQKYGYDTNDPQKSLLKASMFNTPAVTNHSERRTPILVDFVKEICDLQGKKYFPWNTGGSPLGNELIKYIDNPNGLIPLRAYDKGVSFEEIIYSGKEFNREELAKNFLAAVGTIHHYGVMHRDLKPANILVQNNHKVSLIDFGVATHFGPSDRLAKIAHLEDLPIPYVKLRNSDMTIENLPGSRLVHTNHTKTIHNSQDIYGAGIVSAIILTGKHPYMPMDFQTFLQLDACAKEKVLNSIDHNSHSASLELRSQLPSDWSVVADMISNNRPNRMSQVIGKLGISSPKSSIYVGRCEFDGISEEFYPRKKNEMLSSEHKKMFYDALVGKEFLCYRLEKYIKNFA